MEIGLYLELLKEPLPKTDMAFKLDKSALTGE
jgi:hypothetical protein